MKRSSVLLRLSLAVVFCLGAFVTAGTASGAGVPGNRCKDRCNERYNRRMDECNSLRGGERGRCKDRAKHERDDCKRHC
jgi:hypothetical protein